MFQLDRDRIEGELRLGTFSALLRRIHEEQCTGVLHVLVDGVERRVFFKWGDVVFANSDRKDDRLDRRLLAEGVLSSSALASAYEEQKRTGARFGECLVALGALDEAELLAAVERQVRAILELLFSSSSGTYQFVASEIPLDDDLVLDLPMEEILLGGIRSIEDPLALRVGLGPLTNVLRPSRARRERTASVSAADGFVLSRADGETSIEDLLSVSPLTEIETLRSVYALLALGLVEARPPEAKPWLRRSGEPVSSQK